MKYQKLRAVADTPGGWAAIQRDLVVLVKRTDRIFRKLKKEKIQVLGLGRNTTYTETDWLLTIWKAACREGSQESFYIPSTIGQQCAFVGKWARDILWLIKHNTLSRSGEVILPLYSPLVRHTWNTLSIVGLPDAGETWNKPCERPEIITVLEQLIQGEPQRAVGV